MTDPSARELKGHDLWAVERFSDQTKWMIEYIDSKTGDEYRMFLNDDDYSIALTKQVKREIKIKRYAHVTEGHIIDFKPHKHNMRL